MSQVIIFSNEAGGVSVCYPTGELSIETVKEKDSPEGSIIVDTSELPASAEYFNAWELVNGRVVINETKKQAIINAQQSAIDTKSSALAKLTALGLTEAEINTLVG
jgi:hypothetical protein